MKTLYFDCFSGISGDMTIGALLDLGLDFDYLKTELKKLPVEGYELRASRVMRSNLSAMKFDVLMEGAGENHRHEIRHGGHNQLHRKAAEILSMIRDSNLTAGAKRFAVDIFTKLAISEGKVHNVPPDEVEFHEVGAVDSIVDTAGTAIGFDALGAGNFLCSPINIGSGFIHSQQGIMPVPVPATGDLLRHAPIYQKHAQTELVPPTGAAIRAEVGNLFAPIPTFSSDRIGYGEGTKQLSEFHTCLRLMIGEETAVQPDRASRSAVVLEANIDDMTPQNFGYVTEKLFAAGGLDVLTIPDPTKKGRTGHLL